MKIIKYIQEKEYTRFFLMFFSGTLLAQIITMGISPFLTRIYTPGEFGVYGAYLAIVSVLIVFITGRYEYAINAADDKGAYILYKIVNYLTLIISVVLISVILVIGDFLIIFFNLSISKSLLYLVPITLLMLGFLQATTYYLNRDKNFKVLSSSKVLQSIVNSISSIGLGLGKFGSKGLVFSNIISVFISQLYQKKVGIKQTRTKIKKGEYILTLKRYKNFPLYNAPSAFFDNLAMQAPVFVLLKFFSDTVVGFYSLTVRVIGLPLTLISTSISQVFLSQVSELHRNKKSYYEVIKKTATILAIIGMIPLVIIVTSGPSLFSFVFGEDWRLAGEYARILIFAYYAKTVVSPLSVVFFVNRKVKLLSIIQSTRAVVTFSVLFISSYFGSINFVLILYTLNEIFFYAIYYYFILKSSKLNK